MRDIAIDCGENNSNSNSIGARQGNVQFFWFCLISECEKSFWNNNAKGIKMY